MPADRTTNSPLRPTLGEALAPHPATVVQRRAAAAVQRLPPHPATVIPSRSLRFGSIQLMRRAEEEEPAPDADCTDYSSLLRVCSGGSKFEKPNVVIFTTSLDDDHATLYKNCVNSYGGHGCNILNAAEVTYDMTAFTLPAPTGVFLNRLKDANRGKGVILVFASHGNVQWLFGSSPGGEKAAIDKFAEALKKWSELVTDEERGVASWIRLMVLDACCSAIELASSVGIGMSNVCPARYLSRKYPPIPVFGMNGIAAEDCVKYRSANDTKVVVKESYFSNVVIFKNGAVKKPSRLPSEHLHHSSAHMGNPFYARLFATGTPDIFLSKSFKNDV